MAMLKLGNDPYLRCDTYLGYFVVHEDPVRDLHVACRTARRRIVYTTFETTQVPTQWPSLINNYDMLLVRNFLSIETQRKYSKM